MKNIKICLIILITLTLTACGRIELTDAQKERISQAGQKLDESMSAAADHVSEAADGLVEQIEFLDEHRDEARKAAEIAGRVAEKAAEKAGKAAEKADQATEAISEDAGILISPEDIELTNTEGKKYTFQYDGETFNATYTTDHWTVIDSYKITNEADITIICQALCEEHLVHGADMESYRTPEDMAYEWQQHNIAYEVLPDSSSLKAKAKDVDLDPKDQGKSFKEIYEDRTGKELTIEELLKYLGG